MSESPRTASIDLPILGMDCQDEANEIEAAVGKLAGVREIRATVSGARATVRYDPELLTLEAIRGAIAGTGCRVADAVIEPATGAQRDASAPRPGGVSRDPGQIIGWGALGMVAAVVVAAAVGEWLGIFDQVLERLPWWVPALAIAAGGWHHAGLPRTAPARVGGGGAEPS